VKLKADMWAKASFASFLGYTTQLYCLKAAYLAYFLQLKENFNTNLKRFTVVVSVYSAIAYVTSIVLQLAYCQPITRNWYARRLPSVQKIQFLTLLRTQVSRPV
jgi:hypothetical protein